MAITKMKRLRLAGVKSQQEELLRRLQHLGCVEVDPLEPQPDDPDWAGLTHPDEGALAQARQDRASAENALHILKKYAPKAKRGLLSPRPEVTEGEFFADGPYRAALADAAALADLERQTAALASEQSKIQAQRDTLRPWLELDLPLDTPSTPQTAVVFGMVPEKAGLEAARAALGEATDLFELIPAGQTGDLWHVVLVCHASALSACEEALRPLGFSRASLQGWKGTARENDARLAGELAELESRRRELTERMAGYGPRLAALAQCVDRAEHEIAREEARCRLLDSDAAFFLEGWAPAEAMGKLEQELSRFVCAWESQDPAPEEYPDVPVKLKSNLFTEPMTTITEMYALPAYDGVDPNPLMLPFYVFFFGFMFADLAYGTILALACIVIQVRTKPKGGFGQLVRLMIMCGIASAVIGFFTGGFFSDFLARFTGVLGLPTPQIPFLTVHPLLDVMNDPMTALIFSLAVGFVQIMVGMIVKFWMLCREGQVWDAVWDIGTWWVIFLGIALLALNMTGVSQVGSVGGYPVVLILGCLMLLAQGRNGKGFGRVTAIVGAVYNGVTGYFGDVLSYSRLMVMMLAGSVIGQVFNILGAMPGNVVFFFIVFLIGHAFNMAINVIGTYVHTSRLQYLEFFKQFYKEGGRPWRPLCLNPQYVDIKEEN